MAGRAAGTARAPAPRCARTGTGATYSPTGEITFYLEVDRGTETTRRVKDKLAAYQRALAADRNRDRGNILLVCEGRRRLASLTRCAPAGPPWVWGTTDRKRYRLLPPGITSPGFRELPAWPRGPHTRLADCLGRRWRQPPTCRDATGAGGMSVPQHSRERPAATQGKTPGSRRQPPAPGRSSAGDAWQPVTVAPKRLTADDVMTGREIATLLHMPVSTVEDLARRGELPSVKVGRRRLYIRQQIEVLLTGCSG